VAESRPVASMTGFARQEGASGESGWAWEIKSVNGRSLDVRCRLPNGFEAFDRIVRGAVAQHLARGNVQVGLVLARAKRATRLKVNHEVLSQLIEAGRGFGDRIATEPPRLDGLMSLPGVIEIEEEEETEETRAAREAALEASLVEALRELNEARQAEGQRLSAVIADHLRTLVGLVEEASASAGAQPEQLKQRLEAQLAELLDGTKAVSEERLAQEVALLATKADVREELDRLRAHLEAAAEILSEGGPIGRRLDFLCQELNREANTICSKSSDLGLTRTGLQMKSTIEQLREQVQNVE
jgi:uncharacterized protein (TIGR00255 family)